MSACRPSLLPAEEKAADDDKLGVVARDHGSVVGARMAEPREAVLELLAHVGGASEASREDYVLHLLKMVLLSEPVKLFGYLGNYGVDLRVEEGLDLLSVPGQFAQWDNLGGDTAYKVKVIQPLLMRRPAWLKLCDTPSSGMR